MQQRGFIRFTVLPILIDKLLAVNTFFFIWIITAYIRWRFYLMLAETQTDLSINIDRNFIYNVNTVIYNSL
ncbi:hypothetical protein NEOKW01_0005 [Nematocida sp. AWRm80]|nr:hypothetical protein NEOKW01_0005 [Nematocida sp. AWRm80]